ncbi:MAG: HAD family hydrolase [Candidatus Omnitrophota bacterium]
MKKKIVKNKIKVIFLDRDGVINRYPGNKNYVTSLAGFKLLRGTLTAIKKLTLSGYKIYVISNQAGVAKGLYSKDTLKNITDHLLGQVRKTGGKIEKVLYCTHLQKQSCGCRKPKDGLLRKATKGKRLDLEECYFIGDSLLDVKAGKSFGCKTVLVLTGREKLKNSSQWDAAPDFIAKTLLCATNHIIAGRYQRA